MQYKNNLTDTFVKVLNTNYLSLKVLYSIRNQTLFKNNI